MRAKPETGVEFGWGLGFAILGSWVQGRCALVARHAFGLDHNSPARKAKG